VEGERAKVLGEAKKWHKRRRRATRFIPIQIPKTPPPPPIENYLLALDQFLIEGAPPTTTSHVAEQTDYINRKKRVKAPVEAKLGFDVSTEILPGELFSFDEEVEPIAHTVGQKVLEQALLESVEEEELMAIHKEQNEYEERRRLEALRVQHIQELTQLRTKELDEAMKRREAKRRKEKSVETRVGARMFSKSYLTLLVPQLFEGLRDDGFFEHVNIPSKSRVAAGVSQSSRDFDVTLLLFPQVWIVTLHHGSTKALRRSSVNNYLLEESWIVSFLYI